MGVLGLFAFGRMMWWASGQRFAALSGMILLGSDFAWLIQSRIAMLDMVMAGMAMLSLWMLAAAAAPRRAAHCAALAAGGGGDGAGPVAGREMERAAAGRADHRAADRHKAAGQRAQLDRGHDGRPHPGVPTRELVGWLVVLPLLTYIMTWVPGMLLDKGAVPVFGLIDWHIAMAHLQSGIVKHHPYQSVWWQWVIDQRAIWYLYEKVDGAQRGIMLIGNPFIMLAGLPALVWCAYAGMARRDAAGRTAPLLAVAGYGATLGLWLVADKPVQFYYHYLLPGTFLVAALALMLDGCGVRGVTGAWRSGRWCWRWAPACGSGRS
jgi:dolichyl-phosphate-mannose--protein O-mannosyl transferase